MRFAVNLIIPSVIFSLGWSFTQAAQISETSLGGKPTITLDGEIKPGDLNQLKTVVKAINDQGRTVYAIRLNSAGGNLAEGVSISEIVEFGRMSTIVPASAECSSACFVIFAAGNEKIADFTAFIGVHGASDSSGRETTLSGAATVSMARIVKELGVPPAIIGKMVVTPPDRILWLTPDDLRSMGVVLIGKPNQAQLPGRLESQLPTRPVTKQPTTWKELVSRALALSEAQHNGSADFQRSCQPEYKICINAVFVKGKSGKPLMLKTEEDLGGKIIQREFCEFNKEENVRVCTNWDTNKMHRDTKDKNGNWSQISAE